jgi:hypothetical protein
MKTWESVCAFLETLPEAKQDPPGGREVVRVCGTVLAYPACNARSKPPNAAEDEVFVIVKVDRDDREALLHQDPDTFFVTPHYRDYPGVIVRLATVQPDQLRELLVDAWRMVAPKRLLRELDLRGPDPGA